MADLEDGEPVMSLACGHTLHVHCCGQIAQAKGIATTDAAFECPTCRMTNAQATAAEESMMLAAAGPVPEAAGAPPAPSGSAAPAGAAPASSGGVAPAPAPPDTTAAAAAWAYMESVGTASMASMASLEEQQKAFLAQKKTLTKQIRLKKVRDERLMSKAARNLSADQLFEMASEKAAVDKAKATAKAKAHAKGKAKAKGKA